MNVWCLDPDFGPVTLPEKADKENSTGTDTPVVENVEDNEDDTRIVNEVSKQQVVVQYLKV